MKRLRWGFIIIGIILAGALFFTWQEQSEVNAIGTIADSIPFIESVAVKDGKTNKELITLADSEQSISKLVNIYDLPYYKLTWSEKKLVNEDPFAEVDYLKDDEIQYTVRIYEVKEENMSILPADVSTEAFSYSYSYSSQRNKPAYIFAIKETNQLLGINEGMQELLDSILSK